MSLSQFAIAWLLRQPGVTSPIIGPHGADQLKDNLAALDVEITDDDRQQVDRVVPPGGVVSPFYEADFAANVQRVRFPRLRACGTRQALNSATGLPPRWKRRKRWLRDQELAVEFGLFTMPLHPPGRDYTAALQDDLR